MPFDKLPPSNTNYPIAHFAPIPPKPVIPTAEYARTIMEAINKIGENLSPAARAERAAKIAQANYLTKVYSGGNPAMLRDPLYAYKRAAIEERIHHQNVMDTVALHKMHNMAPSNVAAISALTSVAKENAALMKSPQGNGASGTSSHPRDAMPTELPAWDPHVDLSDTSIPPQEQYSMPQPVSEDDPDAMSELPADVFA